MRAVRIHRLGGPDVVRIDEVRKPRPGPGTVCVRNERMGINFGDLLFIRGEYFIKPRLPAVIGMEAAGTIVEVAPDVTTLQPGMRVAYIGLGAFAEYSIVRQSRILRLADDVPIEQGAAFPVASLTAWHLLYTVHRLVPRETVVVHAAAGGVGMAAVQIAKAGGAFVIGTVSSDAKADAAYAIGADAVINYSEQDFAATLRELTGGQGADLILDSIGMPTFDAGLRSLKRLGHIILFGRAGGAPGPIDPQLLFSNSWTVSGFALPQVYRDRTKMQHALEAIFDLLRDGRLNLPIKAELPASQAGEALRMLASRETIGKLVLHWD